MKRIYILLFVITTALVACKSGDSASTAENTTPPPAANNTATPAPATNTGAKPPFAIEDSSKVMNLEGGVKLFILQQGEGLAPKVENKVLAHYNGRLLNGNVFDSSYERGAPTEFPLGGVIKGWQVAFPQLKPGARAVIIIPPAMGYGAQGQGDKIPANSTLVFDVEFVTTM